jgi:hypothetical protein
MKIFISWSDVRSRAVAEALRAWLPNVIQALEPWISSSDIGQGARWAIELATELQEARIGIICLTPENLTSPWILFEAGALTKTLANTFVCPYLIDLKPSDLIGPLAMFQAAKADLEGTRRLLHSINKALPVRPLSDSQIDDAVDHWWPDFEERLRALPPVPTPDGHVEHRSAGSSARLVARAAMGYSSRKQSRRMA